MANQPPSGNRFHYSKEKGLQIDLEGKEALIASALSGAYAVYKIALAGTGFYVLLNVKDPQKLFQMFCKVIAICTGAELKLFQDGSIILTLLVATAEIANRVEASCESGEFPTEINKARESYNKEVNDNLPPFKSATIISKEILQGKEEREGEVKTTTVFLSSKETEIAEKENLNETTRRVSGNLGETKQKLSTNQAAGDAKEVQGKAVQIFQKGRGIGEQVIDEEAIERIFGHPDVADTPVAIYSIAGGTRTGKSFLMNLLLQYLMKGDLRSLQDEHVMTEGFGWRGGMIGVTRGIWIWDKPFYMYSPEGKVAVFLMDTQGTFDHRSTIGEESIVFRLSMLLSSVQILNVGNQIRTDTLQQLELFTEYARAEKLNTKFQNLVFLVRDLEDLDYEFGVDGGKRYWNEIAKLEGRSEEFASLLKKLSNAFESITCCLMPHPGKYVARRRRDTNILKIKDIDEEFISTFEDFANNLFSPERFVFKQITKKALTGKHFKNYVIYLSRALTSNELPHVDTILQGSAKALLLINIQDCREMYRKQMKEMLTHEYQSENTLTRIHKQCKNQALMRFDEQSKFGDEEMISQYRSQLNENIEQEFKILQQINANYLEIEQKSQMEAIQLAEDKTQNIMFEAMNIHDDTSKFELITEQLTNIEAKITKNRQAAHDMEVTKTLDKVRNKYVSNMEEVCGFGHVERRTLKQAHTLNKQQAVATIRTHEDKSVAEDCLKQFQTIIDEEFRKFEENNEQMLRQKAEDALHIAKKEYKNFMGAVFLAGYVPPLVLTALHDQLQSQAERKISEQIPENSDVKENLVRKCKEDLGELLENFQKLNLEKKPI